MSILLAPIMAATLFGLGGLLLLVSERKGERAGRMFLGALAVCTVFGLAVAVARGPGGQGGSPAQAAPRTVVD